MIVFVADVHLREWIWQKQRNIQGDTFIAFEQVVTFAVENDAAAIILGGDTFDPPNPKSITKYENALEKFKGLVYGIDGQHDRANPSWLSVPCIRGEDIHERSVVIDEFTFYGIRGLPPSKVLEAVSVVPRGTDFLVMHQLLEGAILKKYDLKKEWLPEHVRVTLLGDFHSAQQTDVPGGIAIYNGSLVPLKISEINGGGRFITVEEDGSLISHPLKGREIHKVKLEKLDDLDVLIKKLDTVGK